MFEKSSTKSKLVINGILLTLGVILYVGLWYGTSYLSGLVMVEKAKLSEAQNLVARAGQVEKTLLETESQRLQVDGYVLSPEEVVGFIEDIEELAGDIGLKQTTEAVSDVAIAGLDAKKWEGFQMVISVKGSWTRVYQFLSLLEYLPYKTELVQVTIEKSTSKEDASDVWKGDFTVRVLKHK